MACFVVPLTEAVVVSAAEFVYGKVVARSVVSEAEKSLKLESFSQKIGSLKKMLYGGSFLLAIEHIYHGEVVLYPPFLTAMRSAEDTAEMLSEMSTVGVSMAVLVTCAWGIAMGIKALLKKKSVSEGGLV